MKLIAEREETHGPFREKAFLIQTIKEAGQKNITNFVLQESYDMIATKLARIAYGDPYHPDHWRDIIGYATLAMRELDAE
jgi:hypothetical protein